MKRLNYLSLLGAALCIAIPVSGYGAFDQPGGGRGPGGGGRGPGGGGRGPGGGGPGRGPGGGDPGRGPGGPPSAHFGPGFHGRFAGPGPLVFRGGPFFWGPGLGFAFYDGPGYYYYDDAPDTYYHRGVGRHAAVESDNLAVDVQRALAHKGYYHGALDGEIGGGSRSAIRAYQADHGLNVTGRIDNALVRSLGIE